MQRVLVAMSGGIDSSIAATLLQEQGYEVIGITFITYEEEPIEQLNLSYVNDAKIIAKALSIKHYVVDIQDNFKEKIVSYFVEEYERGRTPNPCVICNPTIKWNTLLEYADKLNCPLVATGHYAKISQKDGRFYISQGIDKWKDQSYFLHRLPQEYLKRTLFPLGDLTKDRIREIAAEKGFTQLVKKRESYDVCFVRTDDYRDFVTEYLKKKHIKPKEGNFVDEQGNILGRHRGTMFYTVGQRKGLGVAMGYPVYVKEINPETNEIVLAPKENLAKQVLYADKVNLQKYATIPDGLEVITKIRYKDKGTPSNLYTEKDGRIRVEFLGPVYGVAPGQSAVFYEGEDVVGGGLISLK